MLRRSTVRIPASARTDRVKCGGEVRTTVADHELVPVRLLAEVHDQVAGLPLPQLLQLERPDQFYDLVRSVADRRPDLADRAKRVIKTLGQGSSDGV
jgi:hypothetical protein